MNSKIINSPHNQTENFTDRREFFSRLAVIAGGASALVLLRFPEKNKACAQIVAKDDPRLHTEYITYPAESGDMRAYLARPKGESKYPGVIVIHENKGLNAHIEDVTRRVALEGFLAIAPDGTPCAYQLKSAINGKISLNQWRKSINSQVFDLVVLKIVHPSIISKKHHRSYFVTNGELEEEVSHAINEMNDQWINSGQKHVKLNTIVKGELHDMALKMGTSFLPLELAELKTFLEFQLNDGTGVLPKDKLSFFFDK